MDYSGEHLTEKMQYLYTDIIDSIGQLPISVKDLLFLDGDKEDWDFITMFTNYIIFEYVKYAYDTRAPEYSLRQLLGDSTDDERVRQQRILQFVLERQQLDASYLGIELAPDHKFAFKDMHVMKQKLEGYRLTKMNYFEHQVIYEMPLIKAVVERRIISSKKISNQRFMDLFENYDKRVESLIEQSKKNDEDMVFASIAFYNLEWKYSFEYVYALACLMELEDISEINMDIVSLLCGYVSIESISGGWYTGESRMVKERMGVIDYLFGTKDIFENKELVCLMIKEILVLGIQYKELITVKGGSLYKEWFSQESSLSDWASFIRKYDIFSTWQKKCWTRTRIQNMRKIYSLLLRPEK